MITTRLNASIDALKTVIEESGYFDSVEKKTNETIAGESYTVINCYVGAMLFLRLGWKGGSASGYARVTAFFNGGENSVTAYTVTMSGVFSPSYAYQCANGLCLQFSYYRVYITKNQNGDVVAVFGGSMANQNTDNNMSTYNSIAVTDGGFGITYRVTIDTTNQTLPVPVCTCPALGQVSFTPKLLVLNSKQSTSIGFFQYNGKRYFTDGYFAIEDEEETA